MIEAPLYFHLVSFSIFMILIICFHFKLFSIGKETIYLQKTCSVDPGQGSFVAEAISTHFTTLLSSTILVFSTQYISNFIFGN